VAHAAAKPDLDSTSSRASGLCAGAAADEQGHHEFSNAENSRSK